MRYAACDVTLSMAVCVTGTCSALLLSADTCWVVHYDLPPMCVAGSPSMTAAKRPCWWVVPCAVQVLSLTCLAAACRLTAHQVC